MIIRTQAEHELRPDQVRAMAHGLFHLAQIDGITEDERALLQDFLRQGDLEMDVEALAKVPFSLEELAYSLDTLFQRRTFLKVAILMAQADGAISEPEMAELRRIAQVMGVDEPLEELIADLEGKRL